MVADDGQLKIAVERGGRYCLPLHVEFIRRNRTKHFDLDHETSKVVQRLRNAKN